MLCGGVLAAVGRRVWAACRAIFPLVRAITIASQVHVLMRSASNSARVARTLKNIFALGIARVVERPAEGQFHVAFAKLVGSGAGVRISTPCWAANWTDRAIASELASVMMPHQTASCLVFDGQNIGRWGSRSPT